jgi:hypothetical protein
VLQQFVPEQQMCSVASQVPPVHWLEAVQAAPLALFGLQRVLTASQ